MDRRNFVAGSLVTGLATPALVLPESAWAKKKAEGGDSESDVESLQRVSLFLTPAGQTIFLTSLIIIIGGVMLYLDMQRRWQRFATSRVDVSKVPLLGGLTRPTVEKRLANMNSVGKILLAQTTLFIVINALASRKPKRVSIVNAGNDFTSTSNPRVVRNSQTKSNVDALLKRALVVSATGAHFDENTGELLALIPPEFRKR
ncbi:MAG: hypothetical protein ABJI96_11180 [Paracoccaceae bacterium]|uniref:hypothetical protein n=1 Tax=Parasphingorhabdus sp. TaxID=2709688 RepID=UPI00329A0E14